MATDERCVRTSVNHGPLTSLIRYHRAANVFQHSFVPQGVTIVIALSESHVSCHTWPEEGAIAIDSYTCGGGNPKLIVLELLKYLNSDNFRLKEIDR
jgi:S-adenosylmethionine decarboxylase